MNHQQHLRTVLVNLSIDMRRAADAGERYELPRLADVLARPGFSALKEVVDGRAGGDVRGLQGVLDQHVDDVRRQVEA